MKTPGSTILTLTCRACGHQVSGPNSASVHAAHERHQKKMGHMLTKKQVLEVAPVVVADAPPETDAPLEDNVASEVDTSLDADSSSEEVVLTEAEANPEDDESPGTEDQPAEDDTPEEVTPA